jgi:hypothetical protein
VQKVLVSVEPTIEFAKAKYLVAHDAIVVCSPQCYLQASSLLASLSVARRLRILACLPVLSCRCWPGLSAFVSSWTLVLQLSARACLCCREVRSRSPFLTCCWQRCATQGAPAYSRAVETGAEVLSKVQHTYFYQTAANKIYPLVSPYADPVLDKVGNRSEKRSEAGVVVHAILWSRLCAGLLMNSRRAVPPRRQGRVGC